MNSKGRTLVYVNYFEQKTVKEPVLNNIYWYDPFFKKAHNFTCSRLEYKFVEQMYVEDDSGNKTPLVNLSYREAVSNYNNIKKANVLTVEPKIYEINVKKDVSNKDKIKKWYSNWENYNHTKVDIVEDDNKGIIYSVPNNELDNFTYDLERNSIKYNIK